MLDVLMVEDSVTVAKQIQYQLDEFAKNQYLVEIVDTLQKALLSIQYKTPDIILLDLLLPDSSGIDTVKSITDNSDNTVIIIITGTCSDKMYDILVNNGRVQDFLVKGKFTGEELVLRIRTAYDKYHCQELKQDAHDLTIMTEKALKEIKEIRKDKMVNGGPDAITAKIE